MGSQQVFSEIFSEHRQWITNHNFAHLYGQQSGSSNYFGLKLGRRAPHSKSTRPKFYFHKIKMDLMELFTALHNRTVNMAGVNLPHITLPPYCPSVILQRKSRTKMLLNTSQAQLLINGHACYKIIPHQIIWKYVSIS